MNALHVPLTHRRIKAPLPTPVPPPRPTAVTQTFREPGLVTLHFDTGAKLIIWPSHRHHAAHQANLVLPNGRIVFLRDNHPQTDDQAETYLQLAFAKSQPDIQEIFSKTSFLSWKD